MCAWAETRGAIVAVLSEHHGAEDGHLPSPLVLASAIAARTERLPIMLAEDMTVLDIVSGGGCHTPSASATAPRNTNTSASTSTGGAGLPTRS
jgi:hypothetical protein